ncbi:MAG: heavy metal translocating P-type ATPase [Acetobacter syzygii]|uniref:heavy metal translocating P-type ATPase n=1 Tax=Acetobacter syzygii TaxID=146476 RepID=UPI0005DDA746|nr:heavy metal translocating P-type ATPase [Acetobacter syzygii]GAN72182.1 heavy metal transporter ATPase [Acetobacter syzygii]GBR64157.1 cation transport ATPase [Acetobacter syzygii NRIC 0483]GEL57277.1 heavy metal-transporting ATPase [Acetobacter syzygii]
MPDTHEWLVTGMDCPSCAAKIKGAVVQLPGIEAVEISVMSRKLRVTATSHATSPADIENRVKSLGYGIEAIAQAGGARTEADEHTTQTAAPWYRTGKGHLVLLTATLLVVAWGVALLLPDAGNWPFIVACLAGLIPVALRAFAAIRAGQPFSIEALMTIAATGALFIGATQEAALVVFLFAVGELLEGVAVSHARDGIRALSTLVPKTALREKNDMLEDVAAAELVPGDIVIVRPGDRIPADGTIISGTGGVDESPVTGESMPVTRGPGDPVFAGAINNETALRIQVTRAAADNTIARIIRLVEQAEDSRAPTQRFIDRFSRWYMPSIVVLSALVVAIPPLFFGQAWSVWVYRGLSLLLIGCPCALVISVPAAIASALCAGARHGLLMKGGAVIEATAAIKTVALDKTGTLTMGQPEVTDILCLDQHSTAEVLALAAAVEKASNHPLAQAIVRKAAGMALPPVQDSRAIAGKGVSAMLDGQIITIASPRHAMQDGALSSTAAAQATAMESEGKTVVVLYTGTALALIGLRDEPRQDAQETIRQLRSLGVTPIILTGDNQRTAAAIAAMLHTDYEAELLPEQKQQTIRELAARGPVMMVGDGINDAPALKQATVGVAIGSGTDVALETADAAILRNCITDIPALIRLARSTMSNIRQNVSIALGLKGVFLVTTIIGMTGLWLAIMADTGATVLVTLNALRLLRTKPAGLAQKN